MIERNFQIPFVVRLALAEKQIQQNYRPLIAVHKWFARRPGTLFRSLILSEFGEGPVAQNFYHSHHFSDKHIFDPFMGGGTTVVERWSRTAMGHCSRVLVDSETGTVAITFRPSGIRTLTKEKIA